MSPSHPKSGPGRTPDAAPSLTVAGGSCDGEYMLGFSTLRALELEARPAELPALERLGTFTGTAEDMYQASAIAMRQRMPELASQILTTLRMGEG